MHVSWLDGPAGMIPASVTQLNVLVYTGAMTDPQSSISTVANLDDNDGTGHPDLVRGELPTGRPIRIVVEGQGAGGAVVYLGHVGPFTLEVGERRYINLQMYPVGAYTALPAPGMMPRLLSTATTLRDGRVLITGGYTRVTSMPTCPSGVAAGAHCFDMTASNEAFVFDVATGQFFPVQGSLHQARGGHTATLLPGDRVLIAGGASHAVLVLAQQTTIAGWAPSIIPLDTSTAAGASFEVFLPDANAEPEDADRDGDPGRGGFVGAADQPTMPGRLDAPRFMHGAASVPGHPSQVLLAGGVESPDSWVIYDDERAGGYGVLDSTMNHLRASRTTPNVVPLHGAMGDALWIIGGGDATTNADLAEIWTPSMSMPSGTTVAATMRMFPEGTMTSGNRPELSLVGATAVPLDASHAVVVGWYGPLCDATMMPPVPAYAGSTTGLERCARGLTSRSYTLDGMTGRAVTTNTHTPHAFGAGVQMSDGTVLMSGGFAELSLVSATGSEHFNAMVGASGAAQFDEVTALLAAPRAFHTMTALDDLGALVVGGITINTTGATPTVMLAAAPEIFYLGR
jgi:hypothetical protein